MSKRITASNKRKERACVFCGANKALTDDHIPPKSLFPKPRPSNLITVPSCRDCNARASEDEEYFRLMVTMRHDTGDHPAVKGILPTIVRSLNNPNKKGFKQALLNSIGDSDVVSDGGIYLGTAISYDVKLDRLDRVAARITAGLYFHEFGSPIPSDGEVVAFSVSGLANVDSRGRDQLAKMVERVIQTEPRILGNGVFAYWFERAKDHSFASFWVLAFYHRVFFLCSIVPRSAAK